MKNNQKELLSDLKNRTLENRQQAEELMALSETQLNAKPSPESWSALEAIEHLNRYGDFYIPEIKKRLNKAKKEDRQRTFKSGLLGNKFAKMMLPDAKEMQTFKVMNPEGSELDKTVLKTFIEQQTQILDLLDRSENVNMNKVKTSISISKWLKLKLGDTFRVVIYHNQRHILQAKRATRQAEKAA
jgi:hypothetical protein